MRAVVKKVAIAPGQRVICISDIHGNLDLFKALLRQVDYVANDMLMLLGDLYTKGQKGPETLEYIMELAKNPNVHALRGNCDWNGENLRDTENAWLNGLPHIIESPEYIFVHGGLQSEDLAAQDAKSCMEAKVFMEQNLAFTRYVVAGHMPTLNYTHEIPCANPIVNEEKKIIAIDGGNNIKRGGQLNAFMIRDGAFSFACVDGFPTRRVAKAQAAQGGSLYVAWFDRHMEVVEVGEDIGLYRHIASGKVLELPNDCIWTDGEGDLSAVCGTDYFLPVNVGDEVSIVKVYADRVLAKKDGVLGWIWKDCIEL